jgi:hypothetical protein
MARQWRSFFRRSIGAPEFGAPSARPGFAVYALAAALVCPAVAGPNPPEPIAREAPAWTSADSLAASRRVEALAAHPESIDSLTAGSLTRDHDLGFGRRLREAWVDPAGKAGFAFKIVYAGTKAIAFEARPILNYAGLRARVWPVLAPLFGAPGPAGTGRPYQWNLAAACAPLPADSLMLSDSLPSPAVREALAYYMSPYSGTLYGIRGGEAGQLLENRDRFLDLAPIVSADRRAALWLLRSPNPATRLTAVEFIVRNQAAFPDFDRLQLTAFRMAYSHPAKAATLRGARETLEDPRKLVAECARLQAVRDGRGVLRSY